MSINDNDLLIRKATAEDCEATRAIYNHEVQAGVATFDEREKTAEEWSAWCAEHNKDNHPLLVAVRDGRVIGYASLSSYRAKDAYSATVELSVYVDAGARGRGAGKALMRAVLEEARRDERTHAVISVITASNEISVRLHRSFGFTECGTLREVAFKHGKRLDIVNYELLV